LTSTKKSSGASAQGPTDGRCGGERQIILGIDPGSIITGYGAVCRGDGEVSALKWGVIRAGKSDPLPKRLLTIHGHILDLIDTLKPGCVAVECAFFGKNVRSLIAMGQSVGVALLAAAEKGVEVYQYTPREVKKSVTGNGGASKEQIRRMVHSILRMGSSTGPFDATDALAVALCHENRMRDLPVKSG